MADKIVDFRARQQAKAEEVLKLREHVDILLQCDAILADAIEQMWGFADESEIVNALRRAIEIFESPDAD